MTLTIQFTEPLVRKEFFRELRGWSPGIVGNPFPPDVVLAVEAFDTLSLRAPTLMRIKKDVLTLTWEDEGKNSLGVSTHLSKILNIRIDLHH